MDEILNALWHLIVGILTATAHVWIPALIILAAGATAARYGIPAAARLIDCKRRGIPKELHTELVSLLSNKTVINTYAPASEFISDIPEGTRRPRINAWLSPYFRAVKSSVKRQGRTPRSQFFHARAQIRHAAENVIVRPLTEEEHRLIVTGKDTNRAYAIELQYDGNPKDDIHRLDAVLYTQLGLKVLDRVDDSNPYSVTYIASKDDYRDPLEHVFNGAEFYDAHPAAAPDSIPMAETNRGQVWSFGTHHTLVYGRTGAGKSGPILSTIRQLARFVEAGTVELYAIDPKNTDFRRFKKTTLFKTIATDVDAAIDLINSYSDDLESRIAQLDTLVDDEETTLEATTLTPWKILFIDEVFDLKRLMLVTREGKAAWRRIEGMLSKGRSLGFYMILATTNASKVELEGIHNNLVNKIVLQQSELYYNDLLLGHGAAERGYDTTAIREAKAENNYATSGIAVVKDKQGKLTKVRFAYQSKDDMRAFTARYLKDDQHESIVHAIDAPDMEDVEELPELEPLAPLGRTLPPPLTKHTTREDADIPDT